jgi:hypothetical protein
VTHIHPFFYYYQCKDVAVDKCTEAPTDAPIALSTKAPTDAPTALPTKAPTNKLGVVTKGPTAAKSTKTAKATKVPKGGAKLTKDAKSAKSNVAKGELHANADVKDDPLFTR